MTIQKQFKYKYSRLSYRSTFVMRIQRQYSRLSIFVLTNAKTMAKTKTNTIEQALLQVNTCIEYDLHYADSTV